MPDEKEDRFRPHRSAVDYLLYGIAGSVFATLSFSFALWLKT